MYFKNNLKKWRQGVVASFSIEFTLNKYYKKRWWFFAHRNDVEIKKYVETTRIFRQTKLCQKKVCERTAWIFRPSKLHWKKYVDAMWVFWTAKSCRKKYVETTWIFQPSKIHRKKYVVTTRIFWASKLRQKSTWNRRGFFDHRNYLETSTWKQLGFFDRRNYVEIVRGIDVDISTIEITSKKVRGTTWIFRPSKLHRNK